MFNIRGQNFGLMPELVPYVISGRKYVTSRPATEFRKKLVIGGNMNFFTGMRTPNVKRIGTGLVKEKIHWWVKQIPLAIDAAEMWESPIMEKNWLEFAYIEGFNDYFSFVKYFTNHPKKKLIEEVGLILFVFEFSIERSLILEQTQKAMEPKLSYFLEKEGIIQKGKKIGFEWK